MAFRRFNNSRRSFGSSRSRFRRGKPMHKPGLRRWESTDFNVSSVAAVPAGSLSQNLTMIHLASVQMSLVDMANPDPAGVVMATMKRAIMIGGIVGNYGIKMVGDYDGDADATNASFFWQFGIVSDKLVTEDSVVFPNAINAWEPLVSTFPTVPFASTLTTNNIEGHRPIHIHHRETRLLNFGTRLVEPPGEGLLHVPIDQEVEVKTRTISKRLKLVIDDGTGLFCYFATLNELNFAVSTDARAKVDWFAGTLYWRYI